MFPETFAAIINLEEVCKAQACVLEEAADPFLLVQPVCFATIPHFTLHSQPYKLSFQDEIY